MSLATPVADVLRLLVEQPAWFALLKGSLVLALAGGVHALVARVRSSAALRHAVLLSGIGLALALPLAGVAVPAFLHVKVALPASPPPSPHAIPISALLNDDASPVVAVPPPPPASAPSVFQRLFAALGGLLGLWLAGVAFVLLPVALAYARLAAVMHGARPVRDGRLFEALAQAGMRAGVRARLRVTRRAGIAPATFGFGPFTWVILPEEAAGWTDVELRFVLAHEMAHVARRDWISAVLAQLALAVHWFNPAAWWVRHHLVREAECACDDRVLAAGARPSAYAGTLLDLVRRHASSSRFPLPQWTASSLPFLSPFSRRVAMLLDPSRNRSLVTCRTRVLLSILALGGGALLAGIGLSGKAQAEPSPEPVGVEIIHDGDGLRAEPIDGDDGVEVVDEGDGTLTATVAVPVKAGDDLSEIINTSSTLDNLSYSVDWKEDRRVFTVSKSEGPGKKEAVFTSEVETQAQRDKIPAKYGEKFAMLWAFAQHACKPGEEMTAEQEKTLLEASKESERLARELSKKEDQQVLEAAQD